MRDERRFHGPALGLLLLALCTVAVWSVTTGGLPGVDDVAGRGAGPSVEDLGVAERDGRDGGDRSTAPSVREAVATLPDDVVSPAGASLIVRCVHGPSGEPWPPFDVVVRPANGRASRTLTNEGNRPAVVVPDLTPGPYSVFARRISASAEDSWRTAAQGVVVGPGENEVVLVPRVRRSFRVFVLDDTGARVEGAIVRAFLPLGDVVPSSSMVNIEASLQLATVADGLEVHRTRTDEDGCALVWAAGGRHWLQVVDRRLGVLPAPVPVTGGDLRLVLSTGVPTTVVLRSAGSSGEIGIVDTQTVVRWRPCGPGLSILARDATVGSDGESRIELPPGRWEAWIARGARDPGHLLGAWQVRAGVGEQIIDLDAKTGSVVLHRLLRAARRRLPTRRPARSAPLRRAARPVSRGELGERRGLGSPG